MIANLTRSLVTNLSAPLIKRPAFEPTDIANLEMWLSGDRSPVIFDVGNDISQWSDISGNGNHATQPFAVSQPSKGTTTLNGKDVIRFDGTNFMNLPTATTLNIVNSDYEMIFVFRSSSGAIQFLTGSSTSGNYELHINLTGFGNAALRFIPTPTKFSDIGSNGDLTDGIGHIGSGRVDNNVSTVRADRVDSLDTETPARSGVTGISFLGQRAGTFFRLVGDIADVFLFSRSLISSERTSLENFINSEWAV